MKICPKCNTSNEDTSNFCTHCVADIKQPSTSTDFEQRMNHFEEELERLGEKLEKKFDQAGKQIDTWYDSTFGPVGPIISSIIAFIFLSIFIKMLDYFGKNHAWITEISIFLESLLLIFFIVFLISGYSQYLSKKVQAFRYLSPIIGALIFIFWFWTALQVITLIGNNFDISILNAFSDLFSWLIFPIGLLILIIGYAGLFTAKHHHPPTQTQPPRHQSPTTTQQSSSQEWKRLYRSNKDHIVGGVLGGIAEYTQIDPTIIRIIYIILLFASFGTMVLAYIVGWILIPRNPHHHW